MSDVISNLPSIGKQDDSVDRKMLRMIIEIKAFLKKYRGNDPFTEGELLELDKLVNDMEHLIWILKK